MITYGIGLADLSVWRHDALWEWLRMTEYVEKKKENHISRFLFGEPQDKHLDLPNGFQHNMCYQHVGNSCLMDVCIKNCKMIYKVMKKTISYINMT